MNLEFNKFDNKFICFFVVYIPPSAFAMFTIQSAGEFAVFTFYPKRVGQRCSHLLPIHTSPDVTIEYLHAHNVKNELWQ